MDVIKCNAGHFFDADKYAQCPHCNPAGASPVSSPKPVVVSHPTEDATALLHLYAPTVDKKPTCPLCGKDVPAHAQFCRFCGASIGSSDTGNAVHLDEDRTRANTLDDATEAIAIPVCSTHEEAASQSHVEVIGSQVSQTRPMASLVESMLQATEEADGKTMGFFSMHTSSSGNPVPTHDPVVGWLVCTKGAHFGESFELSSGRNSIGRLSSNKIALQRDPSVSREQQAYIIFDPKNTVFYAQPSASSSLSYVNDTLLIETKQIEHGVRLQFGEGEYLLIALCGNDFSWEEHME